MNLRSILAQRWQAYSGRERQMLVLATLLVLAAALWWLGMAPALSTLRSAEGQRQVLDAQLQQMKMLQVQAKSLQAQPRITPDEARRLLEASVKPLGTTAQLSLAGERAVITLKGASADALTQWLLQVRLNVRSTPSEARLVRASNGTWDGTVALSLK